MKRPFLCTLAVPILSTSLALAQGQLVRGKVEDSTNGFILDCTTIRLVSKTLDLNTIKGIQGDLRVINVGTATVPILDVQTFVAAAKIFDMGNLDLNKTSRWQVNAAPGTLAWMFVTPTSNTGYFPFDASGTWLLRFPGTIFFAYGVTNGQGQFELSFTMPNAVELVGLSITGQAVTEFRGNLTLTNPDCKTVR